MKSFTSKTQKTGQKGEDEAVMFLMKQGYSILERNVANKYGEIDIVAKKGGLHYFFEVKTGREGGVINPAENLNQKKIRKLSVSVEYYCYTGNIKEYRVQGIIVLLSEKGRDSKVETIDLS